MGAADNINEMAEHRRGADRDTGCDAGSDAGGGADFEGDGSACIGASDFASDVYGLVRAIPAGKVLTYGAIATLLGQPGLARRVGKLMSSSPGDVCAHRVVNAAGRTAPGWAEQRELLEREGVAFLENGRVDMKRHIFIIK
ncbi:MAG: MGMT family protein [Oscillospiraceae bacterium]|nr:MGMT family protein [Oscillospiraceae bacterium]